MLKKHCVFFVVPGNGKVLFGMPDTMALKIINLNIDFIQTEIVECKTNRGQETHAIAGGCTNSNAGVITKQDASDHISQNKSNMSINYF